VKIHVVHESIPSLRPHLTTSVVGTGDFNGDGMSDIVWRDTAGDISIWLINGATSFGAIPPAIFRSG
jgi:hypothetical protein